MMIKKRYVVREGAETGIFDSRNECQKSVVGYAGAKYKSFYDLKKAEEALKYGSEYSYNSKKWYDKDIPFEKNSIAVDAACSGNPGKMEYKGIDLQSGRIIFHEKFDIGTNNIGEFLAIVHGLVYLKNHNLNLNIYSDSKRAIKWILDGKCKTHLKKEKKSEIIYDIIKRAEGRLKSNKLGNKILKRETSSRGEIPADFGRK